MKLTRDGLDLARVLEAATDSILVTSSELNEPGPKIVYANPAFVHMTGWALDEIIGKTPRILQGAKTDTSIFDSMRQALLTAKRWEGQTVNYKKDGSEFVMEWSISPLFDAAGQPNFYVAVQRDVTARVENERLLQIAREAAKDADRKKQNLARYFSPGKVDILAERDKPLGPVRLQNVAVLIIDIIGFTTMSEAMKPERVVELLRSFYERMAEVIFRNDGSIENFAGDSLLAIFGVPDVGLNDANNAISCALEMKQAMNSWNEKRNAEGRDKVDVGISAHFGAVVLGDIGTEQSMSFTVIGDPVNTTSRIQNLCRTLGFEVLVTQQLIDQAVSENDPREEQLHKFNDAGIHSLRGRAQSIKILSYGKRKF
ncbi:MAG: adenylate/guanylate cyclase domain-containing protein [Sneathiella sp.]